MGKFWYLWKFQLGSTWNLQELSINDTAFAWRPCDCLFSAYVAPCRYMADEQVNRNLSPVITINSVLSTVVRCFLESLVTWKSQRSSISQRYPVQFPVSKTVIKIQDNW